MEIFELLGYGHLKVKWQEWLNLNKIFTVTPPHWVWALSLAFVIVAILFYFIFNTWSKPNSGDGKLSANTT